jgi:eukaryotic-like serine/threonine-protein kinase
MDETQERVAFEHFLKTSQLKETLAHWDPSRTIKPFAGPHIVDAVQHDERATISTLKNVSKDLPKIQIQSVDADSESEFNYLSVLGRGGMGEVYLARQNSLKREVAVKQLVKERENPRAAQQLIEEARVSGGLEHPSILPIYVLGADENGRPAVVMKRVMGKSWKEILEDEANHGTLGTNLVSHINVLIRVCHAVSYAHSRGVLHRDLKPENIMLGDFNEVYVLDWGIAINFQTEPLISDTIVGTLSYMAPEMALGSRLDPRTDVFLLGACLHELMTGERRYRGSDSLRVLENARICEPYADADALPQDLVAIVRTATAKEPDARYASVKAFRESLEDYLERRGAVHLCEEADDRVASTTALEESQDVTQLILTRNHLAEAKFAYLQALDIWPDCAQAHVGLHQVQRMTIDLEIDQKNANVARALLEELDDPDGLLTARIEALEDAQAKRQNLEELGTQHDSSAFVGHRKLVGIILTIVALVMALGALVWRYQGGQITHKFSVGAGVIAMAGYGSCVVFYLRHNVSDSYNRRLLNAIGLGFALSLTFRILGWWLKVDLLQQTKQEFLVWGFFVSLIALSFRLRIGPYLLGFVALMIAALLTPYTYELFWISLVLIGVAFAIAMSKQTAPVTDSKKED